MRGGGEGEGGGGGGGGGGREVVVVSLISPLTTNVPFQSEGVSG